ncbi:hypothetical protein D3C79_672790 [compost metagenome]
MHGIATLGDIQQGASQRCGHARPHQQAGEGAEQRRAIQVAATGVMPRALQSIAYKGWQLQLEGTKHWQGQHHKQCSQGAQYPRLLQPGLETGAQQCGDYPEGGIDQGHAQHVNTGQCPAAAGTDAVTKD